MATSGSTDFTRTTSQIIEGALRVCTTSTDFTSEEINDAREALNLMVKSWQAEEIGLWKNTEIALFFALDQQSYLMGPSGDHCAETYVKTEVSTAAVSGASTLVLDSITGMTDGDNIGIELDGGDLQWTTINGAPAALTVTLTDVLTDDVSVDNHVYTYTTLIDRPLGIVEVRLHRADGTDIPISPDGIISRQDYMALANKATTGPCNQVMYDPQTTNSRIYVWPTADSVQEYLKMTVRLPIEDFDASSDNPDLPVEWFNALKWNLVMEICNDIGGRDPTPFMVAKATQTLDIVSGFDVDTSSVYFGAR